MNQKKCLKLVFCPFHSCSLFGKKGEENIILHSFYKTSQGRRRRYRCKDCGKTFSSTFGTAYYRLQKSKTSFDNVATMSVNGVDKSSISRMTGLSWTTIERWLEIAALYAQNFNEQYLKGYDITEVQADEIRTFVGSRKNVQWLFTAIEVSSRLWISMVVGKRNYQNLKRSLWQFLTNGRALVPFLFTTDGLELYRWFVQRYLKGIAIYGQIIKKRTKNRVRCVDRTLFSGTQDDLKQVLLESEDSHTLNTSFVERHNLIIRQGCAYLRRKTPAHARDVRTLKEQLELFQCYYNFIRPHSALKFGAEVRTPAKQAGLVGRNLSFRDIFSVNLALFLCAMFIWMLRDCFSAFVNSLNCGKLIPNNT